MKLLRFVSVLLAVSILSTSLVANAGFTSVSDFAADAVDAYEANGVLDGYTLVARSDAKRANVVVWLMKSLGYEPVADRTPTYSDVPKTHPSFGYIEAATDLGLIQGDTDKDGNLLHMFRPNSTITRAEVAKMLVAEYDIFSSNTSTPSFTDVSKSKWYYEYVEAAFEFGIATGFKSHDGTPTGKFGPNDPVSNQEAVLMVYRAEHMFDEIDTADDLDVVVIDKADLVDEQVVEPVAEIESETSGDWVTSDAPAGLPSVESYSHPESVTLEEGGLYGEGSYTIALPEDGYVYNDVDANVHEIYVLEDLNDGLSPFQAAQAIYDALKAELETVTADGYCTLGNPVYDKIVGETEFVTLSYIAVCNYGLDTAPWGEFTYAFGNVGLGHMLMVQFFNAYDVQLPGGAGVDETLTSDWDFISDFLMDIKLK